MVTLKVLGFKGLMVVQKIVQENLVHLVGLVEIAQDKNVIQDYSNEIEQLCKVNQIRYSFRGSDPLVKSQYVFAIGWRWLIQSTGNRKLIILHDSLLPKYRGFAPVVSALINGEPEIGVTAIFASERFDEGDIIEQKKIAIQYPVKIQSVIERLGEIYGEIVVRILKQLGNNKTISATPQNDGEATYSLWRDDLDYKINWNENAQRIQRFINAVGFPYKGAFTTMNGEKIILEEAEVVRDVKIENREPGKTFRLDGGFPIIVCGEGLIKVIKARYAGSSQDLLPLKKVRIRFQ